MKKKQIPKFSTIVALVAKIDNSANVKENRENESFGTDFTNKMPTIESWQVARRIGLFESQITRPIPSLHHAAILFSSSMYQIFSLYLVIFLSFPPCFYFSIRQSFCPTQRALFYPFCSRIIQLASSITWSLSWPLSFADDNLPTV